MVCAMSTRSTSGPDQNHDPLPLRGRQSEWTRIIDLLRQAGRGHRCVLVIDGPGGSGRTRLLTELVLAARRTHGIVFERSGPIPYADLRQLAWECEQLAARLTALPRGTATGPVLVAWDDAGVSDRTVTDRTVTDRTVTDRTVTDRTVGNSGWTGLERFPAFVSAPATPILWALAPRTGEGLTIAGILGTPRVIDVQLRPLPTAAVNELLADLLGAMPAADLAHLAAVASGNPRALVDLVDALLDEGLIEVDAGSDTSVDTGTARLTSVRLPGRCTFRVRGRLNRLSAPARHLVQVASAAGPSFQVSELAGLMRETAAGLLPTIEEALSSGLIVCVDDGLAFSHELVCDIVAGTLPRSIRAALREEVDRARAARPATEPAPEPAARRDAAAPEAPAPAASAERAVAPSSAGWDRLSDTELEIARLVSQALTNRQIATRVYLSPHTINYHLRQIYRKLEINSRVQLANLAQAQNLGQAGTVDSTSDPTSDSTSDPTS
jgi:DNA-binding CsgD family transcriptional regulator